MDSLEPVEEAYAKLIAIRMRRIGRLRRARNDGSEGRADKFAELEVHRVRLWFAMP